MELTTREEAIKLGLKRFYVGTKCLRGHSSPRFVVDNSCCQCKKEKIIEARKNPEFRSKENKREMDKRKSNSEYKLKRNKTSLMCLLNKRKNPEFVEQQKEKCKKWYASENGKNWTKNYTANKRKDPLYLIKSRARVMIGDAFRRNGYKKKCKTLDMLGCSFEELVNHIEKQFLKGMNWENRKLWHIDHITPLSSAKTESDVYKLCHHTNLRPIWASDNFKKSDKIIYLI